MKHLILTVLIGGMAIYPTIPGTNVRDWSQPGIQIEGNNIYQTIPGTNVRDWSAPGAKIEPVNPGFGIDTRDYNNPRRPYRQGVDGP